MIQRKQTVFLLMALAAVIVCLCMPLGKIEPKGMGAEALWYNLGLYSNGKVIAHPLPFVDLVIVGTLAFSDIFLYRRRPLQAKLCIVNIILCLVWFATCAYYAFAVFPAVGTFHPMFAGCLPLVALILFVMAYRGIKADEELIKSMDRIR